MPSKESEFQARIVAAAKRFNWKVWHVPAPMRWDPSNKAWVPAASGAGLPDLILLHDDPPRLVFLELKREGGKLSERQREFLQAAKAIADRAEDKGDMVLIAGGKYNGTSIVGVFAAWPDDEERIIQMLRTKIVA